MGEEGENVLTVNVESKRKEKVVEGRLEARAGNEGVEKSERVEWSQGGYEGVGGWQGWKQGRREHEEKYK